MLSAAFLGNNFAWWQSRGRSWQLVAWVPTSPNRFHFSSEAVGGYLLILFNGNAIAFIAQERKMVEWIGRRLVLAWFQGCWMILGMGFASLELISWCFNFVIAVIHSDCATLRSLLMLNAHRKLEAAWMRKFQKTWVRNCLETWFLRSCSLFVICVCPGFAWVEHCSSNGACGLVSLCGFRILLLGDWGKLREAFGTRRRYHKRRPGEHVFWINLEPFFLLLCFAWCWLRYLEIAQQYSNETLYKICRGDPAHVFKSQQRRKMRKNQSNEHWTTNLCPDVMVCPGHFIEVAWGGPAFGHLWSAQLNPGGSRPRAMGGSFCSWDTKLQQRAAWHKPARTC